MAIANGSEEHAAPFAHRIASFMETTRGGSGSFLHSGQRTEIVSLYSEHRVELAAKVLESNHRSQFHQLLVGKMFLETIEKLTRDPFTGVGHSLGQLQRQPLPQGKQRVLLVISQRRFDLLSRSPVLHRTGCVTVNSIRATVDMGGPYADEVA